MELNTIAIGVVTNMSKHFNELRNQDTAINAVAFLSKFDVRYFVQDDFTVALVSVVENGTIDHKYVGVSKRNPTDHKNVLRGRSLALSRALKSALKGYLTRGV